MSEAIGGKPPRIKDALRYHGSELRLLSLQHPLVIESLKTLFARIKVKVDGRVDLDWDIVFLKVELDDLRKRRNAAQDAEERASLGEDIEEAMAELEALTKRAGDMYNSARQLLGVARAYLVGNSCFAVVPGESNDVFAS